MRLRTLGLSTATFTLCLVARNAAAQQAPGAVLGANNGQTPGFDMQQFTPAPAGDRFFGVPDAVVSQNFAVAGVANYAYRPLRVLSGGAGGSDGYIPNHQLYAHLDVSVGLWKRVLLNVDVPFAVLDSGDSAAVVNGQSVRSPSAGRLGDIRLTGRINVFGEFKDPIALGLQADVWAMTGSPAELTGDTQWRANPKLVISGHVAGPVGFSYALNGGYLFRHPLDFGTPEVGPAITFGAAAGISIMDDTIQIGPELYGHTVTGHKDIVTGLDDTPFLGTHSSPIELLGGAKFSIADKVQFGVAGGPGLTKTPGTPVARALATIAYTDRPDFGPGDRDHDGIDDEHDACPDTPGVPSDDPRLNGCPTPPPADRDGDGIPDSVDACPDQPGAANADPAKNGCPPDRDGDGIPDAVDACPDAPGVANADPAKNGCPADRDGDGIADNEDACPDVKGVKNADPKKNGCPADRDGDGIADAEDACPDQPGERNADPKKNGCPAPAKLVGKKIEISEQVHFAFNKATIQPDSDQLLTAIGQVLKDHPEVTLLSIDGHTDNVGNKNYNKKLSQERAAAVKKWLSTKGGVDAKRLTSQGFGDTKPIAPNDTEEGRALNRRVELTVVKNTNDTGADATGAKGAGAATKGNAAEKSAMPKDAPKTGTEKK